MIVQKKRLAIKGYIAFILTSLLIGNTYAQKPQAYGAVNIQAAIKALPDSSNKPFEEKRLVDNGEVGVRVFRVYNSVPVHNHAYSSTYLKIESGSAIFSIDGGKPFKASAGELVFWERGVNHQVLEVLSHPLVFLAIDAPTRRENDVQK